MEEENKTLIRISVRNLVEFVLRSGDLDNRRTAGAKKEAMLAGGRLHRKIQKKMDSSYRAEVSLKHQIQEAEFGLLVEGRADGIFTEPGGVVIDEIKCVYMDLKRLEEAEELHLAQARCYAYIYAFDCQLAAMGVQITYCNIETEEIRRFRRDYSFEELREWFEGLVHEYLKWAEYQYHHELRRNSSLRELAFPFPYRQGQKGLAAAVYRSVDQGRNLFVQAPTGTGKTLAVVFPCLKAMGEGKADKLFYLTAKTITRSVAEEAFQLLRARRQLYFSTVTITAKDKLCVLEKPQCNPEACPRARGHFDRVNDAVFEIIHSEASITRETILEYARRYEICPFEFCLDISSWVDGIICDYNYVFDPDVRLKRYFADGSTRLQSLFLVDEAHNLVPRAREMYSACLFKEDLLLARRILKAAGGGPQLLRQLDRCNQELLQMKRNLDSPEEQEGAKSRSLRGHPYQLLAEVNLLSIRLSAAYAELEAFMNDRLEFPDRDLVLDFYFQLRSFLYIQGGLDDHYRIYTRLLADGRFMVKLLCVNPALHLKECLEQGRAAVFFSATLLPIGYYKELLGGSREEQAVYAQSPFASENRLLLAAGDVSSMYRRRTDREYRKAAAYIRDIVEGKTGNYIVFCPSYQYLDALAGIFDEEESLPFRWMAQTSRMDESQKEEFLELFQENQQQSLVALCVMGGIFSEGIDLREERLIGAIVIGTGLPQINVEQEVLREYFEETEGNGFAYAYQYPGMNKVLQAAGRVIRTDRDKGIIALLDDRFLREEYQLLFPREWDCLTIVNRNNVSQAVADFWQGQGPKASP